MALPAAAALLVSLAGCLSFAKPEPVIPPQKYEAHDEKARLFLARILERNYDGAFALMSADRGQKSEAEVKESLKSAATLFGNGSPVSITLIGLTEISSREKPTIVSRVKLSYELELTSGWYAGYLIVANESADRPVTALQFGRIRQSLADAYGFQFFERGAAGIFFLAAMVAVAATILIAAAICIRSAVSRKWLWLLFILFGLAQFQLNWVSGGLNFTAQSAHLLGISMYYVPGYEPWRFGVSLPIGALCFLVQYWRGRFERATGETKPA